MAFDILTVFGGIVGLAAFLLGIGFGARYFNKPLPYFRMVNKPIAGVLAVALIGYALMSGGYLAGLGLSSGTIALGTVSEQTNIQQGSCPNGFVMTAAGCVSNAQIGSAATVNLFGYDWGSGTKTADPSAVILFTQSGAVVNATAESLAAGQSQGGFNVGDVLTGYIVDATDTYAYPEPKSILTYKVIGASGSLDVNHISIIDTEGNFVGTNYDDTGAATLTAADDTTAADSKIALGANQEAIIYWKISQNDPSVAYDLAAICMAHWNNTVAARMLGDNLGGTYSNAIMPEYISDDANCLVNRTETWDSCVVRNEPLRLTEYESVILKVALKGGATDPVYNGVTNLPTNGYAFMALDSAYFASTDGSVKYGYMTDATPTGQVGLTETTTSPLGQDEGTIIEVT